MEKERTMRGAREKRRSSSKGGVVEVERELGEKRQKSMRLFVSLLLRERSIHASYNVSSTCRTPLKISSARESKEIFLQRNIQRSSMHSSLSLQIYLEVERGVELYEVVCLSAGSYLQCM